MSPHNLLPALVLNCSVCSNEKGPWAWQVHLDYVTMDLLSQHTQNTTVSHNSIGWGVRIQRNSSKWCSFFFLITSQNVTSYASQTLLKLGSNRAIFPGPYSVKVVERPEVNNEENWQCFYGIHKATIFMKSFVQIHSIVEHHNTMYYLAWN